VLRYPQLIAILRPAELPVTGPEHIPDS